MTAPTARLGEPLRTYSGGWFYPLDPRPAEVRPADLAHALALINRYAGHTVRPYSVAEHSCLLASWFIRHAPQRLELARWALLHDAVEAYLVDIPRPVKGALGNGYRRLECGVMHAVALRFGLLAEVSAADLGLGRVPMPPVVKEADTRIIRDEMRALFADHWDPLPVLPVQALGVRIHPSCPWREAEAWWLRLLARLELA